ncbi:GTPase Era [Bartonella sp. TP]|uniref:GTPase Era n=1 Tax=Bartonella sp. TP TaxID=3057550 RepID=UPI0025AEDAA8|nr:GTPase Era [Bartonella sp. TP]WJW80140.1 GTPase Era [Bartonella sp. TP]
MAEIEELSRAGFVALIGASNAGKSTFLNKLVGSKVSIVTHKVQTTRTKIRGIVNYKNGQIVFIDTPGLFEPKSHMDKLMVHSAWGGAEDADIVTICVDVSVGLNSENIIILDRAKTLKQPKILILNKIDLITHAKLLALIAEISTIYEFAHIFMVSALKGVGCEDYLKTLVSMLPLGPHYYPDDQISDMAVRQLAAEITREKLYLRVHKELPYSAAVITESYTEQTDGSIRIEQIIYVERQGQKKIVLGKQGAVIKAIGLAARKELCDILGKKVHLFLFVKTRPNWKSHAEDYIGHE